MGAFIFAYLEYIVAGAGAIGAGAYIVGKTRKTKLNTTNDLSFMAVKNAKHRKNISKRTDSIF